MRLCCSLSNPFRESLCVENLLTGLLWSDSSAELLKGLPYVWLYSCLSRGLPAFPLLCARSKWYTMVEAQARTLVKGMVLKLRVTTGSGLVRAGLTLHLSEELEMDDLVSNLKHLSKVRARVCCFTHHHTIRI